MFSTYNIYLYERGVKRDDINLLIHVYIRGLIISFSELRQIWIRMGFKYSLPTPYFISADWRYISWILNYYLMSFLLVLKDI